jgi:hypothetical protein
MCRQGDVLFIPIEKSKVQGKPVEPENGRYILARGEATGHDHSVSSRYATMTVDEGGLTYLTVDQLTEVQHQEHGPIPLDKGAWRVIPQQREYVAGQGRNMGD